MGKCIGDYLFSKVVVQASQTIGGLLQSNIPFDISVGWGQIIEIHGIIIDILPSTITDQLEVFLWVLNRKNETRSASTTLDNTIAGVNDDNDAITCGFMFKGPIASNSSQGEWRHVVMFPVPLCTVRSPTLQVKNAISEARTPNIVSTLLYRKVLPGQKIMTELLKMFIGRKQTAIPNVPLDSP